MEPTAMPRVHRKIGIAGPPIETPYGWLLLLPWRYRKREIFTMSKRLPGLNDPLSVSGARTLPYSNRKTDYEKNGIVNNVVFSCWAVVIQDTLYFYLRGGDKVIGVGDDRMNQLMEKLRP